jgi:hypothetical protein
MSVAWLTRTFLVFADRTMRCCVGRKDMATEKYSWEILDSVEVAGGRLALVARPAAPGLLVCAGIAWEDETNESFPKLLYGGKRASWQESRLILITVKKFVEDIEARMFNFHRQTAAEAKFSARTVLSRMKFGEITAGVIMTKLVAVRNAERVS